MSLHELFESIAKNIPDKVAIFDDENKITYGELDCHSDCFANYLMDIGINCGENIAVFMSCSVNSAVVIIGISKMGGACVPIEWYYSKKMILNVINNLKIRYAIIDDECSGENFICDSVNIIRYNTKRLFYSNCKINKKIKSDSVACILHTSGSTGVPKAVMITHETCCRESKDSLYYGLERSGVYLLKTNNIRGLFQPLWVGGSIVIADNRWRYDVRYLIDSIKKHSVTVIGSSPSILKILMNDERFKKCHSLQRYYLGGEAYSNDLLCRLNLLLPEIATYCTYGATETSVVAMSISNDCIKTKDNFIGLPTPGTRVYLRNSRMYPTKNGDVGEIFVSGNGLAIGYVNDDYLNKNKFVFDPVGIEKGIMYRTGDYGRLMTDGNIVYLGRVDRQVKVRGFRIELDAIEREVMKNKNIESAGVIHKKSNESVEIVLFLKKKNDSFLTIKSIQELISESLPKYMHPNKIYFIEKMPLMRNGKINYDVLVKYNEMCNTRPRLIQPPRNNIEKQLLNLWKIVLHIEEISVADDFFDIGGDSLSIVRLIILIEKEFFISIDILDVLRNCNIATQSKMVVSKKNNHIFRNILSLQSSGSSVPIYCIPPPGGTPLSYLKLSNLLGSNHPLYSFIPIEKREHASLVVSVKKIANIYIDDMLEHQGKEPYILMGMCFGGTIAFEMARQLKNKKSVVYLVLLDPVLIKNMYIRDLTINIIKTILHYSKMLLHKLIMQGVSNNNSVEWAHKRSIADILNVKLRYKISNNLYFYKKYYEDIVLFRSVQMDNEEKKSKRKWSDVAAKEIKKILVNGSHYSVLDGEELGVLAERLKKILDEISS